MITIANYSFLPWLRQGIANTIAAVDGDPSVQTRSSIGLTLQLSGDPIGGGAELTQSITQSIQLFGPGDIIGIDSRAIVRTEPRNWITNFESNYMAAVDFYDEDFPWRYTPTAPDASMLRLRPWIALVVLTEREFKDGAVTADRPLPFITVTDPSLFPPADQLWAWAHVHFNQSLSANPDELVSPDMNAVLPRVQTLLNQNPDLAYSRILCPRHLDDNTGYHAFIVPVFETGRLAGLGHAPDAASNATFAAWTDYTGKQEAENYPIYYRWYFRTGSHGDFEYLVGLLKPQPVDPHVGTRNMDVQDPGSNILGITDPALGGVLRLGGALRVPDQDLSATDLAERQKYENWDQPYPTPFQVSVAKFINLQDDYATKAASVANSATAIGAGIDDDPDPIVTSPLYGQWHALTKRLLFNSDGTTAPNHTNWVHNLNLDPHYRVPAAIGAKVVETNAEDYMNAAWEQIGDVLAANQRIRRLVLAKEVSWRWHTKSLVTLAAANAERALMWTTPVSRRVVAPVTTLAPTTAVESGSLTVAAAAKASPLPPVYTAAVMRRIIRPGSRLMRSLPFTSTVTPQNLLTRINSEQVRAAPPKVVPLGVVTIDQVASTMIPTNMPPWILALLMRFRWLPMAVLIIALVLALLFALFGPVGLVLAVLIAAAGIYLFTLLKTWINEETSGHSIEEANQTPATVDDLPKNPTFALSNPGSTFTSPTGATDSPTAVRFKSALRDSFTLIATTNAVSIRPVPVALDFTAIVDLMVKSVDPQVTIAKRGLSLIAIPDWIRAQIGNQFGEVMAYPRIDLPMYQPLKDISSELFLPNINLIPQNSITLVETNQKFIEAYMVGLNHEFARKLLWREYPTDQRGSYFRQFWDVRGFFNVDNLPPDQLKEKLRDIPELHRWALDTQLGQHNNRQPAGDQTAQAVLVIRGELLKKYPTAVIYAHHAEWARESNGSIDLTQPRSLQDIDVAFEENPPPTIVRTPLYEAKVDPDIYFFGFDLTVAEAKGGSGRDPKDDPGWFFVIKQRPGEPRFGLELTRTGALEVMNELTWDDPVPKVGIGQFLQANTLTSISLSMPPAVDDKQDEWKDDEKVQIAQTSAARWAYLLFRAPVMVAVHADEMLKS
jgi:hypothetical protein